MSKELAFSMIELLVVITIVGILSSIGIAQYSTYKSRTFDLGARVDLRTAAEGEEAYFIEHSSYLSCANDACLEAAGGLPGLAGLSPSVLMTIEASNAGLPSFVGNAEATQGSGISFEYDSTQGGFTN